jgi:hypothetical protein
MDKEIENLLKTYHSQGLYNKISYNGYRLILKPQGSKLVDGIWLILLLGLLILSLSRIQTDGFAIQSIFTFCLYILIYILVSRGDNIISIDFKQEKLFIKKRSIILSFLPSISIAFKEILDCYVKSHVSSGENGYDRDIYLRIIITKRKGVIKNFTLIEYHNDKAAVVRTLLKFFKKIIITVPNKRFVISAG